MVGRQHCAENSKDPGTRTGIALDRNELSHACVENDPSQSACDVDVIHDRVGDDASHPETFDSRLFVTVAVIDDESPTNWGVETGDPHDARFEAQFGHHAVRWTLDR